MGYAKHMKSKHCNEPNYFFITPPEYEEATVKEGAVMGDDENNDSVEIKIGHQGKKSNQIFCIILIEIFSLVELYQDGDIVAEGRVVELQPCSVHNHPITSNEVKVEVSKLHKPTIHPTHGYDIEEGAFTAWNLKNIAVIS